MLPSSLCRLPACLIMLLSMSACGGPTRVEELLIAAHSSEIDEQRGALRELADIGPDAAAAIADLIDLSDHPHPDIRRLSGLALGNIAAALPPEELESHRREILEVLTRMLEDDELAVRNTAAFALLGLEPDHAAAQDRLKSSMRKGDGGIIDRLTHMHPPPAWTVPTLVDLLHRDPRPGIRRLSAVALGAIDPDGDETRKALHQALSDSDDQVRSAAQDALNRGPL